MVKRNFPPGLSSWQDAPGIFMRHVKAAKIPPKVRLEVGMRFHRVGLPSVVWQVLRVYPDRQSVEHAVMESNRWDLDNKTLSAVVLLDSRQYRSV